MSGIALGNGNIAVDRNPYPHRDSHGGRQTIKKVIHKMYVMSGIDRCQYKTKEVWGWGKRKGGLDFR